MAHDEGFYAVQALDMVRSGHWIDPLHNSYDRTIGIQWLMALAFQVFGVNENVARLPNLLAAIASIALTFRLGSLLWGELVGFVGGLILMTTHIWTQYAQLGTQDLPLSCVELVAIWALIEAARCQVPEPIAPPDHDRQVDQRKNSDRRRNGWLVLAGSTFGLGFLLKGFMVFPFGVALLPYMVLGERKTKHFRSWGLYLGMVIGWVPPVVWLGLSVAKYGSWLPVENLFGKLFHLSQTVYHGAGPAYYLWNVPVNTIPWWVFTLWGTVLVVKRHGWRDYLEPHRGLLLSVVQPWLLLGLLNLFTTRTRYYPLQVLPWFSLLAAIGLIGVTRLFFSDRSSVSRQKKWGRWAAQSTVYGVGLLGVVATIVGLLWLNRWQGGQIKDSEGIYGVVALVLGIPWCGFFLLSLGARWGRSPRILPWLGSLGIGPWCALLLLNVSGVWGNYVPEFKTFLESGAVAPINGQFRIHRWVAPNLSTDDRKTDLLLDFYTQNPGRRVQSLDDLGPEDYLWASPELEWEDHQAQTLAQWEQWSLLQVRPTAPTIGE